MRTAEYAENAESYYEIRLSALCGLSGEIFHHLLLYHYLGFNCGNEERCLISSSA